MCAPNYAAADDSGFITTCGGPDSDKLALIPPDRSDGRPQRQRLALIHYDRPPEALQRGCRTDATWESAIMAPAVQAAGWPAAARRSVLIIVENLPVPFDRRVWKEARTLSGAGYAVSVICPTGKGYEARYEVIDGIHIYRHPLPLEARSALGYPLEYLAALSWEFFLAWRVLLTRGFDAIHACNPPD